MTPPWRASIALFCALGSGAATSPERGKATPKWRADLGSVLGAHQPSPYNSIWFTDNNTIVATWVVRTAAHELAKRDGNPAHEQESFSLRIRPVLLEAATGRVIAAPDWPAGIGNASVIAAHEGKFVVQTSGELTRYGPGLKPLQKLKLPAKSDWAGYPSESGRHVLFVPRVRGRGTWLWLDTDTLQIVRSWEDLQMRDISVADGRIARVTSASNVEVGDIGGEWKTIARGQRQFYVKFVGEDLLYVPGNPNRLLRPDGQMVFKSDAPYVRCAWGIAHPSADGRRFVVPECAIKGAIRTLISEAA
jgi:hypothetical protein